MASSAVFPRLRTEAVDIWATTAEARLGAFTRPAYRVRAASCRDFQVHLAPQAGGGSRYFEACFVKRALYSP